jgi:hypothetical protein
MHPVSDSSLPTSTSPLPHTQDNAKHESTKARDVLLDDTFPPMSDPWRDDNTSQSNANDRLTERELKTPDPSLFDQAIAAGILDNARTSTEEETKREPVSKDVLSQFDPLAESAEEQAAHDAWESAESHPPPPRAPSPPAKESLQHYGASGTDSPTPPPVSPTPSSSFPSLAALARTFSIPSFSPKTRPLSLDTAKPIASPSTLSSFAAQQEKRPDGSEDGRSPVPSGLNTPAQRISRAPSPLAGASSGNDNGSKPVEGQFDFQKFLDQMKTKSAEPVSKYLRSWVMFGFFASASSLITRSGSLAISRNERSPSVTKSR